MKLYEVDVTEDADLKDYDYSYLLAARTLEHAWQLAREYFLEEYVDDDDGKFHSNRTDDPNRFECSCGFAEEINAIREISFDAWIQSQVETFRLSCIPDYLLKTQSSNLSYSCVSTNSVPSTEIHNA